MKVAVLFGGTSAERDVSVTSGAAVFGALKGAGHKVLAVDTAKGLLSPSEETRLLESGIAPDPPERDHLSAIRHQSPSSLTGSSKLREVDVIFLALHGGSGEDGTIQAMLDFTGIAYTGSGLRGSANAMDKDTAKNLFCAGDIPTPPWRMSPITGAEVGETLGFPAIVKPNREGSTIGLTLVRKPDALETAIQAAHCYDDEVIIEQFIAGREFTVPILDDRPLPVGEIIPRNREIFDYSSKYQAGEAEEIFPAEITAEQTTELQALGLRAHQQVKAEMYSRVDFRMDSAGRFWCLEVNTLPGMTGASLLPKAAQAAGIAFPELCERICQMAIKRRGKGG